VWSKCFINSTTFDLNSSLEGCFIFASLNQVVAQAVEYILARSSINRSISKKSGIDYDLALAIKTIWNYDFSQAQIQVKTITRITSNTVQFFGRCIDWICFYARAKNKYISLLTYQETVQLLDQNKSYLSLQPNMYKSLAIKANDSPTDDTTYYTSCFIKDTQNHPDSLLHIDSTVGQKNKVWLETYGCAASKADSEMIAGQLKINGYELAKYEEESSLNIIVTCSVKDATEHKMLHRIRELTKEKKPTVLAGCLPKADKDMVEVTFPSVSLLGPHSIDRTIDVVNSTLTGKKTVVLDDSPHNKINIPRVRLNPIVGIVEIASGCMSECTFCQTKLAKGEIKSYPAGQILRQIKHDIKDGCKEIWLTSTDNGCYGKDHGSNIVELLELCCTIDSHYKIRVGMMNPMHLNSIVKELLEVYENNEKIFKFLHVPVQSGSDRVLRKMKRGHSVKTYRELVKAFRSRIPEITIATDIIVGFPSESEDDFEQTLQLIRDTQPDIVNSSKFSARPNTAAANLKQLRSDTIKNRTDKLHLLVKEVSRMRNSMWLGWRGDVIVDELNNNNIVGRNYAYRSVIVSPLVASSSGSHQQGRYSLGTEIEAYIYDYTDYSLKGQPVEHYK
jgi:threonylcarbamoyladenosine tRNA methylthiotransferase CDKAL1